MTPIWPLKIAAYLNRPPDYSLFPDGAEQRAEELIQVALGGGQTVDFSQLKEISEVAAGLDIPPFVKKLDAEFFRKDPRVVHPLSAQEFKIQLPELNEQSTISHIKDVLVKIKRLADADLEKLFLALWRLFPEWLAKKDPTGIGRYWKILPADPRIPSHTIWDHASVASAIAGAWPEPAILIFTIASAQEMVTTARRTQDAWMSSFLLSYLSWEAIRVVAETCGPDALIFPSLRGQPLVDLWLCKEKGILSVVPPDRDSLEVGNIPNIFTAIVPKNGAEKLASKAEKAVQKYWDQISQEVRKKIEEAAKNSWNADISSWGKIWERQNRGFIESLGLFWVICPWGKNIENVITATKKEGPSIALNDLQTLLDNMRNDGCSLNIGMAYHLLSSFAGKALTARKNLRNFNQVHEPGHKCSLCGKWQAVHPDFSDLARLNEVASRIKSEKIRNNPAEESYAYRWLSAFWEALGDVTRKTGHLKLKGRIRRGDRLCSACLTRRLALEAYFVDELGLMDWHLFPSTAGIATLAYRGKILDRASKGETSFIETLDDYVEKVESFIEKNDLPHPAASPSFLKAKATAYPKGKRFLKIDGDWIFESSFDPKSLKNSYKIEDQEEIKKVRDAVRSLNLKAKELNIGVPPRYYAILALDGDHMGDWVTSARAPWYLWLFHPQVRKTSRVGELIHPGFYRPLGPALQLALSDSLKNFSLYKVQKIVEKDHAGKLIYAGGEDVLAFLAAEDLLPVMEDLYIASQGRQNGFEDTDSDILRLMGGTRQRDSGDMDHQGITVSMGIVIAHHTFPLYQAMQEARRVLKNVAKDALGRNAFAIRLLRRSGEFTEAGYGFTSKGSADTCNILKKMEIVFKHLQEGNLSGRLAYEMAENTWADFSTTEARGPKQGLDRARQIELARITRRHAKKGVENEVAEGVISLFKEINKPIKVSDPHGSWQIPVNSWKTMRDLLLILRFMAAGGE